MTGSAAQQHNRAQDPSDASGESHEADIILGLAKSLASTLELDKVLDRVLDALQVVVPSDSCSLFLAKENHLELCASRGISAADFELGLRIELEQFPLDRFVMESGTALIFDDVQLDPRWALDEPVSYGRMVRGWMGIPLSSSGQTIGMLTVDSLSVGAFSARDLELAKAFADLAAVAVRNARLFADSRRRLKDLESVNRLGRAVASHLDSRELCEVVGENLLEIFAGSTVFVSILDDSTGLIMNHFASIDGKRQEFPPFALGQGITSHVLQTGEMLYIDTDVIRRVRGLGAIMRSDREVKCLLMVPILSGRRALGVLSIQSFHEEKAYSEEDIKLLTTIAANLGAGIRNARLYEEAKRAAQEAEALAEAGSAISQSLDPEVVLARIAERALKLLSDDSAAVYLIEECGSLRAQVAVGTNREEILGFVIPQGAGILSRVVREGKSLIVNDVRTEPDSVSVPGTYDETSGERFMAAPLFSAGQATGAMAVWRKPESPEFVAADLRFLDALAKQASMAIENAHLHRRVAATAVRMEALYDEASAARAEAEEAALVKAQFLANMTHELRTPLNSVINLSFLIQAEGESSPGVVDLAERIESSGRHLLQLINDVLDLSKIEAGRMEVFIEDVDVRAAARAAIAAVEPLTRDGVAIFEDVPRDLPLVRADRTRLRQVLLNLLSNAAKFTARGSIAVSAKAEGAEVIIEVEDTGIGMEPGELPRAFEEFVQLDADMDRRSGGTGLGLPLSRRFVELQGGRLWAVTSPGEGSIFKFTLPRADMAEFAAAAGRDVTQ